MSDFNYDRGFPFYEETISKVLVSEVENGWEQRRDVWGKTKKKFTIHFNVNSKTEIGTIRDFFVSKTGPKDTFTFTNPVDSTEYTVRYVDNSFKIERQNFGTYNARVELIEVFS